MNCVFWPTRSMFWAGSPVTVTADETPRSFTLPIPPTMYALGENGFPSTWSPWFVLPYPPALNGSLPHLEWWCETRSIPRTEGGGGGEFRGSRE